MFKFKLLEYDYNEIENTISEKFNLGIPQSSNIPNNFVNNVNEELSISGTKGSKSFFITIEKINNEYMVTVK